MCGVAGIWHPASDRAPIEQRLRKMSARLRHRGPDEHGIFVTSEIGLCHQRLSIIDPEGGQQPMTDQRSGLSISYNGEIFNYLELREQLIKAGWQFNSHSDTEVLLAAYHHFGIDFLTHLNGQFAFALWDQPRQRLLLARDHAGIHPLFYTRERGEVIFASEVKALVPAMSATLQPDLQALDQIFTSWAPLPPATGFQNVFQVLPGQCLILSAQGESETRFFDWSYPAKGSEREAPAGQLAEELFELLNDAVRIRLRADVPVGCYLSGGVDSSVITSLVHRQGYQPTSFSVNFDHDAVDEGRWQRQLYQSLGLRHFSVSVSDADIAEQLPKAIWHAEKPILRSAPVPMMQLSRSVRQHGYKVVLTGEGADEVLAGYDLFKEAKVRQFWSRQAGSSWRWQLLKRLYPWMDLGSISYLKRFFGEDLERADDALFSHYPRMRNSAQCKQFFSAALREKTAGSAIAQLQHWMPEQAVGWAPLHRAQYLESRLLMDGYLLSSQGDRMLMANSVEGRFPFLDPRLIRFANELSPRVKLPGLKEKNLLKLAASSLVPAGILNRPKQPYRAPDVSAIASAGYAQQVLSESALKRSGYFDSDKVSLLWRKAKAGRLQATRDQMALMGIISTQLWHEQFIEGKALSLVAAA